MDKLNFHQLHFKNITGFKTNESENSNTEYALSSTFQSV